MRLSPSPWPLKRDRFIFCYGILFALRARHAVIAFIRLPGHARTKGRTNVDRIPVANIVTVT
jgi:hypothetical protein